jgi:transposase
MNAMTPAKGTVWTVRSPTVSFYRMLPGKSADEGRQVLNGYRGTVVADGFVVYDVLARDGPAFTLTHCWSHAKRKYEKITEHWPVACAEIGALIGELYAIERLVRGAVSGRPGGAAPATTTAPGTVAARARSDLAVGNGAVGLPRSDFGKAVRYMLERWAGLTRFVDDPASRSITTRPNGRSVVRLSVGRTATAPDRCVARRSRRSSTPCVRPRSWWALTRTHICSAPSMPRSPGPERSRTLQIS